MGALADISTIARWEVKKSFSMMSRDILPLAVVLFILLVAVTGFSAQNGLHLQDGMYRVGVDDSEMAQVLAGDARFTVFLLPEEDLIAQKGNFDLLIINGFAYTGESSRSVAARKTLERDYSKYVNSVYNREEDLFAAYPLWIDTQSVKSELSFLATQSGQYVSAAPVRSAPVPEGPVERVATPSPTLSVTKEELRGQLVQANAENSQISRYTETLSTTSSTMGTFKTPSQLS
ncbi:MAG TPA: PrsW family intramembrane metalloprotease, partial [Methanoregula sp.]|nr:PrsW family intramembrane metalloprotease [Methanoregula sp.]